MSDLAIKNIGKIVTGDLEKPLLNASVLLIEGGKIKAIGDETLLQNSSTTQTIDVAGAIVSPGLIDSHTHPVIGDYTPRQDSMNYLEGFVHGGVTSIISAGEVHTPGRPTDPTGTKALALLARRAFSNFRPLGLKIHAGALILEKGLTEEDFAQLSEEGIWLVGEVGLGSVRDGKVAEQMVAWAKKYNMKVHMHTGGTSIPGSSVVTAEMVKTVQPTLASHINGGPTAIPKEEIDELIEKTTLPLEVIQCGNLKIAEYVVKTLKKKDELHRILIGTDTPSGSGVMPLGMFKTITHLAGLSSLTAAEMIACATGNTAEVFDLNTGKIAEGKDADLIVIDRPIGSIGEDALEAMAYGNVPAVLCVIIDGEVKVHPSKHTPPSERKITMINH